MPEFYPPQLNLALVRSVQLLAPWVAHLAYRLDLEIDPDSLKHLSVVRNQRVLLLPNHPTFQDPIVLFLLSGRMGQAYYYLAAHEQFQGLLGRFFQLMGVYSIRRGLADRTSIAQTLELLTQPNCQLVIFSEGGCSFQNDTVMPFRAGAVQLAFQAMNRQVKQGYPVPDLYVLPVSIKYRYTQNMARVIDTTLSRLEQTLQIPRETGSYVRLRAIAAQVLRRVEQSYGIDSAKLAASAWDERIAALKAYVLDTCEQQLGLTSVPGEPNRERVYRIQSVLQTQADRLDVEEATEAMRWDVASMQRSMQRLLNFDAIYDGYVAANPTPERFMDTLIRLEREVFEIDIPPSKGHCQAHVRVGKPTNLKSFFAEYQKHRSTTVDGLVRKFQRTVQINLDLMNESLHEK